MLPILIKNEFTRLRSVLFGTAQSNGPIPLAEDCYDPSSLRHVISGTYPTEVDMSTEIAAVLAVFDKYDIQVFQPTVIDNCNQIFTRDIAFVIEDKLIKSNILPDRDQEINALDSLFKQSSPENNMVPRPPKRSGMLNFIKPKQIPCMTRPSKSRLPVI